MRMRQCDKILPVPKEPVRICECGKPIYDGRRKLCPACSVAMKKIHSKRSSTIARYAAKEELVATIAELEDSIKMQQWMIEETKKRVIALKAIAHKI
jgi:hypothetical protein